MNQEKTELEQALDEPYSEGIIELNPDAKYKLATGNVKSGKELLEWERSYTRSRQKETEEIRSLQEQLQSVQKEKESLYEYLQSLNNNPNKATNDSAGDYDLYGTTAPQNPDINQIVEQAALKAAEKAMAEIRKLHAQERQVREREETVKRAEQTLLSESPDYPLEDFYGVGGAIRDNNVDSYKAHIQKLVDFELVRQQKVKEQRQADTLVKEREAMLSAAKIAKPSSSPLVSPDTRTSKLLGNDLEEKISLAIRDFNVLQGKR